MQQTLYSQPSNIKGLDGSYEKKKDISVFPRNFYSRHPFAPSVSYFVQPRDTRIHYTYDPDPYAGKERHTHVPVHSRFGYDRFFNEYGAGPQSRGYIEPPECSCNEAPPDTAPARFYSDFHLSQNPTEFRSNLYAGNLHTSRF